MEAPGYKKDDITISVDKGELTVTFEKNDEQALKTALLP